MTTYADPGRCPDCRAAIDGGARCARCGLLLRGAAAGQLFSTLQRADQLLATLRTASTAPAPSPAPIPAPIPAPATPAPRPARPARVQLSSASVPAILLTVGAGCLLVASSVFLVVAWSVLGVGGRTAVLVLLTVVAGLVTRAAVRRGLRAAAESFALVGFGLLALDLTGAAHAGWFGELSTEGLLDLVGGALLIAGTAGAVLSRRPALAGQGDRLVGRLVAAEAVAAVGVGLAAVATSTGGLGVAPGLVVATGLAAACAAGLHRLALPVAAVGSGCVAALTWLGLTEVGLGRALDVAAWRPLWVELRVWPLLVAVLLAATPALVARLPRPARVTALGVAHSLLTVAALVPVLSLRTTPLVLVAVAVLLATAACTRLLPGAWAFVGLGTQALTVVGVGGVTAVLTAVAAGRLLGAAGPGGRPTDRLTAVTGDLPAGWVLPLCVLALVATAWTIAVAAGARTPDRRTTGTVAGVLVAATGLATAALFPLPLALVLALLLAAALAGLAGWLATDSGATLGGAAVATVAAVVVGAHAELLLAVAGTVVTGLATAVALRARPVAVAAAGGAVGTVALATAGRSWAGLTELRPEWAALASLLAVAALVLAAPCAADRWAACPSPARVGVDVAAALSALALGSTGVGPAREPWIWSAVYLTVAGVAVTVLARVREDRRAVGPLGAALLVAATWVRLWDLGVGVPEAYTLPSALLLLAAGVHRLHRDPEETTVHALAPGLCLALAPSLLWVLEDPTGLRSLLLGLACLGLVLLGARQRWTAPLTLGAVTGAVLVLRLAGPYVDDALPRWVLIGAAGALLVALGTTWEQRVAEARSAMGRLRSLR